MTLGTSSTRTGPSCSARTASARRSWELGAGSWELGAGQGHILIDGSDASIDFAFIVALPDGFDPAVPYPLLVFLHHGWDVYRGTDNDGLPLEAPLFAGDRSLIADSAEHARYPAIVLIPQMRRVWNADGVTMAGYADHERAKDVVDTPIWAFHFQTPGVAWGQEPGLFEWLFGQLNDRR